MSDLDKMMAKFQSTLAQKEDSSVDFNMTAKYDQQKQTLAQQLKMNQTGVFNPFESKINEHAEEEEDEELLVNKSQDSFDREL